MKYYTLLLIELLHICEMDAQIRSLAQVQLDTEI